MNRFNRFLIGIACLTLVATNLAAQSIYGTLTGIVSDPSQSVVAGATVKLRDEQSGSQRETVTNAEGFYTFVSVPPGGYELTVSSLGVGALSASIPTSVTRGSQAQGMEDR